MAMAHLPRDFGHCRTAAVLDASGNMVAGFVFHNWQPETGVIECSGAALSPAWAKRSILKALFGYVFKTAGCQMVVARTAEENTRVRRLWKALGAAEYVIPRLRGREASEAILCITDDAWHQSRLSR
ncbi:GNAT family N-acetyltransferase [Pararhodobacter sp. CCB-MM2]|uniref:GNAT family N-acetyltransferase n=1 Tax=Pararhodobacter sp. CCB-MM2 TaxID=1786003 RepID=UPI0011120460|nr:GNAT family protein [Pararhodobacter sp. CCB-MM2]